MAFASKEGKRWRILFDDLRENPAKRVAIRPGRFINSRATADNFARHVGKLIASAMNQSPLTSETAGWLAALPAGVHERLVEMKLTTPRESEADGPSSPLTLAAFLDHYIGDVRNAVEPATKVNWRHTRRNLVDCFGADFPVRRMTVAAAKRFREYLEVLPRSSDDPAPKLSPATIGKRVKNARLFFGHAVDDGMIDANPFAGVKGHSGKNPDRLYFVQRDAVAKLLEKCPDIEWKLIVALSRYGGLRCPSEHFALVWGDVDWERERITVRSRKTRKQGKALRVVPLFPELRPLLQEAFDRAAAGTLHVISRHRGDNLRTHFNRIIKWAGLEPWPRLFHNMRSSRQTELAAVYPAHVVCGWLGNSEDVAKNHYLQVTDDDYRKAVQNPHLQAAPSKGNQTPTVPVASLDNTPNRAEKHADSLAIPSVSVGPVGREQSTESLANSHNPPSPASNPHPGTAPLRLFFTSDELVGYGRFIDQHYHRGAA